MIKKRHIELIFCSYTSLDHVVAQQYSFRKPGIHEPMKRVDIVDSLAHEAAFAEEMLLGIGDCAGIYVESSIRGEDGRQPRFPCRLQVHAGLRL